jgi:LPS O-antigen subunit length determinant protein (WzzB/FepE family)
MRLLSIVFCLLLIAPVWAKDSASQTRTKLRSFLDRIQAAESQARPIEPMLIPMANRSREETKELERRIQLLDDLINQKTRPLGREISQYQAQMDDSMGLQHSALREAYESLDQWLSAKLSLQNAGVNNPSLDALKKNEPTRYQEYQAKLKAAQEKLK